MSWPASRKPDHYTAYRVRPKIWVSPGDTGVSPESPLVCPDFLKSGTDPAYTLNRSFKLSRLSGHRLFKGSGNLAGLIYQLGHRIKDSLASHIGFHGPDIGR
jgi:hypothetical protein